MATTTTTTGRAVGYRRVSTSDQVESGAGLAAQADACTAAAGRLGLELVEMFTDEGVSGASPLDKRTGLLAAIAELGKGDTLLVAKRDRLARDVVLAAMVGRLVERKGARIMSAAGEGTESTGPEGLLMRGLVDLFAEYERAIIRCRTKAAMQAIKVQGGRVSRDRFGYDYVDGRMVVNSEEQEALLLARGMRAAGESYRAIAAELERRGVATKRGGRWSISSVRSVLMTSEAA